ncbi:CRTAC1 family protein [Ammonicoccus fulvus]|uniref:CRTAC1 family protein n=1 Tax=Ammonicoccus fulvus TaxID=3138240 RepID=A0ABZ3FKE4_9ACTN
MTSGHRTGRKRPRAIGYLLATTLTTCTLVACGASPTGGSEPSLSPTIRAHGAPNDSYEVCWAAPAGGSGTLAFVDRTDELGLTAPLAGMMGHAIAAGDINDDGWVDLFVGTFADRPPSEYAGRGASGPSPDQLLLGSPTGFTLDTTFPETRGRSSGAVFADLDNDGDLDLVIARNPRTGARQTAPSVVLRNDDGRFSEAGVLDTKRGFRSIGVLDADGDGLLDLFVTEDRWTGGSSVLYRNNGDLRFSDATTDFGLPKNVHGLGVSTADLNGDQWPDLFVSGSNRLFLHRGPSDHGFTEDTQSDFGWPTYGKEDDPAGVVARDLDGDGRPELVIGQHYNSTLDDDRQVPIRVYANRTEGNRIRFVDVTDSAGLLGLPTKSPHVEVADLDADGLPDLVTTAAADEHGPVVFRNVTETPGRLKFEVSAVPGGAQYWVTGSILDADHDGALDVALVEWFPEKPSLLLSTTGSRGHWLAVELGAAGTLGVGSEVSVYAAGHAGDAAHLLGRAQISAQSGYGAGAEPVARFGLGDTSRVDIEIRRLRSEPAQILHAVEADRWIRVGAPCP